MIYFILIFIWFLIKGKLKIDNDGTLKFSFAIFMVSVFLYFLNLRELAEEFMRMSFLLGFIGVLHLAFWFNKTTLK